VNAALAEVVAVDAPQLSFSQNFAPEPPMEHPEARMLAAFLTATAS
jgi:hypothetical protein